MLQPQPSVRPARAEDRPHVRAVLEAAFRGAAEAGVVERLRGAGDIILALVAELSGDIVGYAAFVRLDLHLAGRIVPVAGLAPVGVAPERQCQGVGSALIHSGLARLKDRGERLVFVLGEPGYYGRFGFAVMDGFVSRYAGPYFQTLMLMPDAPTSGKITYPPAFDGL